MKDCCSNKSHKAYETNKANKGFLRGILYGILPHSFCIAFVILSVLGVTVASTIFRKFLLIPYFFELLIGLSFIFATLSAVLYLKRKNRLSVEGIRDNLGYLGILFGTTIAVNLFLFFVIFPAVANKGTIKNIEDVRGIRDIKGNRIVTLVAKIPCSGHAPLVVGDLRGLKGVREVKFIFPNLFEVSYDQKEIDIGEILKQEIFKTFPVEVKSSV